MFIAHICGSIRISRPIYAPYIYTERTTERVGTTEAVQTIVSAATTVPSPLAYTYSTQNIQWRCVVEKSIVENWDRLEQQQQGQR